ncbi:MAG: hypothetical protein ACTHKQ_15095 [Mesorhizobium sp.]
MFDLLLSVVMTCCTGAGLILGIGWNVQDLTSPNEHFEEEDAETCWLDVADTLDEE